MIKFTVHEGIATVVMDAPPVNAQSSQFCSRLVEIFGMLNDLPEARAVLLTGAGKNFSAGADIREYGRGTAPGTRSMQFALRREAYFSITNCHKPVVAAVNGAALGAGLGLALCCDIMIATEQTVVGLPEIDVGMIGGGRHAMRAFPYSLVRRLVLTGDRITGPELYRRGLVEACVPPEELMAVALDMARKLASKSPVAMRYAKRALGVAEQLGFKEGFRYEQEMSAEILDHPDSIEAINAFFEKRLPRFGEGR